MQEIKIVKNEKEMRLLGEKLGEKVVAGMTILMTGGLGAGKTTMTKGIAKGLGIEKTVTSPTFTICKIYQGRLILYHFDAYRLEGSNEDLGFDEMIQGDGISVVEWPEYLQEELALVSSLEIEFQIIEEDKRELKFTWNDEKYTRLMEGIN
ncbi:MAG: tRNA (adenosine(37)-N6)-threonylcarbamoyltransferase complex ATPase subunit type 1 TsaE [Anaerorhabdus sp.]